jgi:ribonuclease D
MGHGALVNQVLGIQLAKGETLTEWRDRPLTKAQVRYAFDDVRFLLPLWQRLSARLEKLGRHDWAEEEFHRLAVSVTPAEGLPEKWRKLRGLGALDRRRLAVVRELHSWREEMAAATNRPARTIVRDDLLVEIARRNPAKERDLQAVRGLARRHLEAIVQVVARATALPSDQWPVVADREQDPPQVALVSSVLLAVLGDFAVRHHLAPNLIASTQDVKALVRARLQHEGLPTGSLLVQGWRRAHVLPELLAVLEGRRRLRIADVTAEAPFAYDD